MKYRAVPAIVSVLLLVVLAGSIAYFSWPSERSDDRALPWNMPALENPETIRLSDDRTDLRLADDRDYRIVMPCEAIDAGDGLSIVGGHNVVLVGGTSAVTDRDGGRGLHLVDQTGTVHVEGLRLTGEMNDGITMSQTKGATVQLRDIVVEKVKGSREGHHADVLQTWAGPAELRIDGLVGTTEYQGFFLAPNQHYDGPRPELFDLRNIEIRSADQSGYSFWLSGKDFPMYLSNVTTEVLAERDADRVLWPKPSGDPTWSRVTTTGGSDSATLARVDQTAGACRSQT